MDINTLPIQTNVATESNKSSPRNDSSTSAENGSFSDKLQQASNKPVDSEKTQQTSQIEKPAQEKATPSENNTDNNAPADTSTAANSLLALVGMQIKLAEKNTPAPTADTKLKAELTPTENAPDLSAALAATAAPQLAAPTIQAQTANTATNTATKEQPLNIPAHLLTNTTHKADNTSKALANAVANTQDVTQAALNTAVAATAAPTKTTLENSIILKPDNELQAALTPNTVTATESTTASQIINNNTQNLQNSASNIKQPVLASNIGSTEWQQGLGQQVIQLHQRGEQQIELHLHPAELGPLSISLKVSDNIANVQFVSAHGQVRHAVEQALPQLRDALAEQGISLGQTSVGSQQQQQTRDEQASRSLANQQVGSIDSREIDSTSQTVSNLQQPGQLSLYA